MKISQLGDLRSELGGKGFLDPKLYLLIALVTAPLGGLFGRDFETTEEFLNYLIANLVSLMITAIPFFAIRAISKSPKVHFGTLEVLATGAVLGFTKAFSTAHLVAAAGLENIDSALQSRLASGVMIGIVIVLLFSAIPILVDRFEQQRLALVRSSVATELSVTVAPVLDAAKQKLADLRISGSENANVADELIAYSNEVLRPKLVELWGQKARTYQSLELTEIVRYSFRNTDTPLLPYLLVIGLGTMFRGNYEELGFFAFLAFMINLAVIGIGVLAANFAKQKGWPWLALLISTFVTGTSLTIFNQLGYSNFESNIALINFLLAALFAALHTMITTVLAAGVLAITSQEKDQAKFELALANSSPREVARVLAARRAAEILHGQVQSWILASAIRIRQDPEQATEQLAALSDQIENAFKQQVEQDIESFRKDLREVWGGVIDIQLEVSGSLVKLDVASQEVIREAINNSRKHGSASAVSVLVEGDSQTRKISVRDNGTAIHAKRQGIGSALMTSLGVWSLTPNELGGTTLNLTFGGKN